MTIKFLVIDSNANSSVANTVYNSFDTREDATNFIIEQGIPRQIQVSACDGDTIGYGFTIMGAMRNYKKKSQ